LASLHEGVLRPDDHTPRRCRPGARHLRAEAGRCRGAAESSARQGAADPLL